tara:strand:+ start:16238 stop:16627 length:390 start_codon:yes stop_codon:yes gene_type:complete
MTSYNFQPDPKRPGRNQYVGSWTETNCGVIDLPLTKESLVLVLRSAQDAAKSPYTHQEIAWWADNFHMAQFDNENQIEAAVADVAFDLHIQWQMNLSNAYSLEELQNLDFSKVQLPAEWFSKWLKQLDA